MMMIMTTGDKRDIMSADYRILSSNQRPTIRECVHLHVVTCGHFRSRDKDGKHRSRIRYLSKKNSRILTNFPKLKKFVKKRKKFVKCPSGRGLPTTTEEYDAFHGFMLIKM